MASLGLEAVKAQDQKDRAPFSASSLLFDKAMPPSVTQALVKAVDARGSGKGYFQARDLRCAALSHLCMACIAEGGCNYRTPKAPAAAPASAPRPAPPGLC
jgi:hypothetical protein